MRSLREDRLARIVLAGMLTIGMLGCTFNTDSGTIVALREDARSLPPLASLSISAGSAGSLQLSSEALDVVKAAMVRHPEIQQAASEIGANGAKVRFDRAALFPQVGVGFSGLGIGSYGSDTLGLEVTASQLVTDFGVTNLTVEESDLEVQRSYLEFQRAANAAAAEVLVMMSEVLRNRELQQLRSEQLNSMRDIQTLVLQRREAGASAQPDTLETSRRIQSAEYRLFEAEAASAEAHSAILEIAGVDFAGYTLPAIEQTNVCNFDPANTFDVLLAQIDGAIAETALNRIERSQFPSLSVAAAGQQPFDGSEPSFRLGLNVGMNIFEGGAHSASVDQATNILMASRSGVERAMLSSSLERSRWQRQIAESNQKADMVTRQVALLDSVRNIYRSQYLDLGVRSLSELLDSEEDYFALRGDAIDVRYDHINAGYECMARSGELLRSISLDSTSLYGYPLNSIL